MRCDLSRVRESGGAAGRSRTLLPPHRQGRDFRVNLACHPQHLASGLRANEPKSAEKARFDALGSANRATVCTGSNPCPVVTRLRKSVAAALPSNFSSVFEKELAMFGTQKVMQMIKEHEVK